MSKVWWPEDDQRQRLRPGDVAHLRRCIDHAFVAIVEARAVFHGAGYPDGEKLLDLEHIEHLLGKAVTEGAKL